MQSETEMAKCHFTELERLASLNKDLSKKQMEHFIIIAKNDLEKYNNDAYYYQTLSK